MANEIKSRILENILSCSKLLKFADPERVCFTVLRQKKPAKFIIWRVAGKTAYRPDII